MVAVAAVATLSACSSSAGGSSGDDVQPIEIVSQPESVGDAIDLDIPLDDSGAFEFDSWPSACDLADKKTLSGIFPGSNEVSQTPRDRQLEVLVIGGDNRNVAVNKADCVSQVGFPGKELSVDSGNVVFNITTSVQAAGNRKYLERNARQGSGDKVKVGGANCTVDHGMRYDCVTDKVAFNVTLDARAYGQYFHSGDSTYKVDGKQKTYSGELKGFDEMVQEKVLLPLVKADVERLS
jgi:hypothetical protein